MLLTACMSKAPCACCTTAMLIEPGSDAQEVQEDEPKPAAVVPFAGAWATLSALLNWPARGGSPDDELNSEDSSVTSGSHSDTSSSRINSGRAASISSCIRGDSDSVTTDRNSLNSQGSMVTSPRGSFASAESEDSSAESEDGSAESEVSSAESEVSSGKHSFSGQVTGLGGQGAGEVDEQGAGRGAAECKIKASWPDLAGQTTFSQHLYLCSRWVSTLSFFPQQPFSVFPACAYLPAFWSCLALFRQLLHRIA